MPPFDRHLHAARGYLDLGLPLEAHEEIEAIEPEMRTLSEVLALRVVIFQALAKWDLMEAVAAQLCQCEPDEPQWPIMLAHAIVHLRPATNEAIGILMNAMMRFDQEPAIRYALACYEVRRGQLDLARTNLTEAIRLSASYLALATGNPDLAPLLDEME